jgi:hypothetical protein
VEAWVVERSCSLCCLPCLCCGSLGNDSLSLRLRLPFSTGPSCTELHSDQITLPPLKQHHLVSSFSGFFPPSRFVFSFLSTSFPLLFEPVILPGAFTWRSFLSSGVAGARSSGALKVCEDVRAENKRESVEWFSVVLAVLVVSLNPCREAGGGFLMWCGRQLREEVEDRAAEGGGRGERLMQVQGRGLESEERRTLRRKPQLHVNCCKRRVPPHPGGMGR